MRVFDTLWLKAGFALHAYEYRAGSNGNGIIWAVPADARLVAPGECPRLEDTWLQPPRPPAAVRLMQAIEGDGSPWSYLSASILRREAAEFGAIWHGCVWSDQTILSKPPRQADSQDASADALKLTGDAPAGNWTWHGAVPHTWKPTYADMGTTREVVLHIHNPIGGRRDLPCQGHLSRWQLRWQDRDHSVVHGRPVYRLLTDLLRSCWRSTTAYREQVHGNGGGRRVCPRPERQSRRSKSNGGQGFQPLTTVGVEGRCRPNPWDQRLGGRGRALAGVRRSA